ncbi:MAG: aminotransferase class I/II-fold pyridoxal phosphate-dependent enzyme [Gemmatimonas sp.]
MNVQRRADSHSAPGTSAAKPLHVGRPNSGDRAALFRRLDAILDHNWLTNDGPMLAEFESRLAAFLGVRHCLCVCNGTVGLEILVRALGLRGEVILPAFTFVATAHALTWLGLRPVFCDIDPATHLLDPAQVEAAITSETTAICGVHLWGEPCAVPALQDIAARHGLRLFFDAAHAFGCATAGRMIGQFGDAEVFSFHATKVFNTFEGGAIATNDDALAERIVLMRNFGFTGIDRVDSVGTNGKMPEFSAAVGLTNLESLDGFIAVNRRNLAAYTRGLDGLPGVRLRTRDVVDARNYQYVVIEVDESLAGVSRDVVLGHLWEANVFARRYFWPGIHRVEPYVQTHPDAGRRLPETERVAARVLVLPTGPDVGDAEVDAVCGIIRTAISAQHLAT